jgi:Alternative splicing regulator
MDKWGLYPSGGDSGILKKQLAKEPETNNLLVFGYSCKIFRDDAKAWYLDQGKHLIQHPIEDIKIDRLVEFIFSSIFNSYNFDPKKYYS